MERDLTPEWILKQTLAAQDQAHTSFVNSHPTLSSRNNGNRNSNSSANDHTGDTPGLTLTVVGCGTMGVAILGGILDSLSTAHPQDHVSIPEASKSGTATPVEPAPARLPSRFYACVRRHESTKRIRLELGNYEHFRNLTIRENDNLGPVQEADVVLLCCKPQMVGDILTTPGMREALAGKLLISICAGVTEDAIHSHLYEARSVEADMCTIVRAMPNTAAAVRESMTVIGNSTPPLPPATSSLVTWIFTRIGRVVHLPSSNMDACTALCGSGPAFVSLMVESLAAGAIAMGLPREESYLMAEQMMRGTTGLLLRGEHPAILRDKVSTPGGCTIGGLLVLEEGRVRGTIAKAVREATVVASQLGQGKQGVNGTRMN